jgi:hypothetical protein
VRSPSETRIRRRLPAAAIAALALGAAAAAGAQSPLVHPATESHSPLSSTANWAGYAVTGLAGGPAVSFTHVTGTWKATFATCDANDDDAANSVWVGLGGFNQGSQSLEQIGTESHCSSNVPPSYYAWYQLVPGPALSFALTIEPGDTIKASVTVAGGTHVTLVLRDLTRDTVASERAIAASPDLSSAEWIAEAPSECDVNAQSDGTNTVSCGQTPLANFGSVTFSKSSATGNGHTGTIGDRAWAQDPVQLVPSSSGSGNSFGTPSSAAAGTCAPAALSRGGALFTVRWTQLALPAGC